MIPYNTFMTPSDNSTGQRLIPSGSGPVIGVTEWFRPGEHEHVEQVLEALKRIGIRALRTGFSWADLCGEEREVWYAWLLPRLARDMNVLLCFSVPTPGLPTGAGASLRGPDDYAEVLDLVVTRFGDCFEWVELHSGPAGILGGGRPRGSAGPAFYEAVAATARWCRERGKKTVLGGVDAADPVQVDLLCRCGVMLYLDAVGVRYFPAARDADEPGGARLVARVREVLDHHHVSAEVWITEGGFSTWHYEAFQQLCAFVSLTESPAARAYWYSAYDLPRPEDPCDDERPYHFGLLRADGRPKLLYRILAAEGLPGVRALQQFGRKQRVGCGEGAARTNGASTRTSGNGAASSPSSGRPAGAVSGTCSSPAAQASSGRM